MKFLHHLFSSNKPTGFDKIEGYEEIKDIVMRALDSEDNYNLLFTGPPASAKTLFLLGILDIRKNGVYFDGSNSTNRILDVLEEERPEVICIDELDKMSRQFQNQLLNFLESGRIKVDQQRKSYDFEIRSATCNEINRLSKPLQSLFRRLHLPPYTRAIPRYRSQGMSQIKGGDISYNWGASLEAGKQRHPRCPKSRKVNPKR